MQIAAHYSSEKTGASYIINNNATEALCNSRTKNRRIKRYWYRSLFWRKGLLSKEFPQFEYRHEQYEMAKFIEKGINDSKKVIIEAGQEQGRPLHTLSLLFMGKN